MVLVTLLVLHATPELVRGLLLGVQLAVLIWTTNGGGEDIARWQLIAFRKLSLLHHVHLIY